VAPATGFGRVIPARVRPQTSQTYYHRNQQYSIVGLTNAAGTLVKRFTYSAYGTLGIYAANGTVRTSSTYANRYTYTGREWDSELRLYHFRARWYDPATGGFVSRDPLGYVDGMSLYRGYFGVRGVDPSGMEIVDDFGRRCCYGEDLCYIQIKLRVPCRLVREQVRDNLSKGLPAMHGAYTGHARLSGGCRQQAGKPFYSGVYSNPDGSLDPFVNENEMEIDFGVTNDRTQILCTASFECVRREIDIFVNRTNLPSYFQRTCVSHVRKILIACGMDIGLLNVEPFDIAQLSGFLPKDPCISDEVGVP
jgi:RHS repeat-associated protein